MLADKGTLLRRLRRNRSSRILRSLCAETRLSREQLIFPLFVCKAENPYALTAMEGMACHSLASLVEEVGRCVGLGIKAFALFAVVDESKKDKQASEAICPDNFYLRALRSLRKAFPEIVIISDVALDPYSSDGHDGLVHASGEVLNDETLPILGDMAVVQASAGVSMVAPSDMMDGRVGYIRRRLDEAGHKHTGILSYTAKYASALYAPFRAVLDSAPRAGDKKTYQMNTRNQKEALEEAALDIMEGADILMVKPAGWYLDVIYRLSKTYHLPIAAYQVSGEYAMLRAAAKNWKAHEDELIAESLYAIRRAGAQMIISYFADRAAEQDLVD